MSGRQQRRSQKQKGSPATSATQPAAKVSPIPSVEEKKVEPATPPSAEKSLEVPVDNPESKFDGSSGGEKKDEPNNARLALTLKAEANDKFKQEQFVEAIELYTKAIALDPGNHILFCNRSTARSKFAKSLVAKGETTLGQTTGLFHGALEDALACVDLKPDFVKGYLRAGQALMSLGQVDAALHLFEASLSRFPNDPTLLQERDEAKKASTQARDTFPLSTQFLLNMKSSPALQRHPNEPKLSEAEEELTPSERDRLLHSLFGSRYSLVPSQSPRQQWTFFYGEPPNRRSATNWMPQEDRFSRSRTPGFSANQDLGRQPGYFEQQQLPRQQNRASFHQGQPAWARQTPAPSMWDIPASSPLGSREWFEPQPVQQPFQRSTGDLPRGIKRPRFSAGGAFGVGGGGASSELHDVCEQLRVVQYYPDLLAQGVETVDDLLTLPPEFVRHLFPTLGHQARVLDFIRRHTQV